MVPQNILFLCLHVSDLSVFSEASATQGAERCPLKDISYASRPQTGDGQIHPSPATLRPWIFQFGEVLDVSN